MKFGAHIYLWTDRWTPQGLHLLDQAKELGLDCFEIACGDDVQIDISSTGAHARSLGLELVLSPGGEWPMECDISLDDPQNRQRGVDWHRKYIEMAGELGAIAYTGAIYGHPGCIMKRRPPDDELPRTAENLHHLADVAESCGVELVLEPMSHFRTHLVNTVHQAVQLIELAGHKNLKVLLDTYHLVTETRDYEKEVHTAGDLLWGVHACENDRGVPGGGLVPWTKIFKSIADIAMDGYIILETYNSSLDDFAFERGMFHNVCPNGNDFVRTGLSFLQEGLHKAGANHSY